MTKNQQLHQTRTERPQMRVTMVKNDSKFVSLRNIRDMIRLLSLSMGQETSGRWKWAMGTRLKNETKPRERFCSRRKTISKSSIQHENASRPFVQRTRKNNGLKIRPCNCTAFTYTCTTHIWSSIFVYNQFGKKGIVFGVFNSHIFFSLRRNRMDQDHT